MPKEVFSEQEASRILQRAVDLHEAQGQTSAYTPGITPEELSRIALEMGVSTEYLTQAISEVKNSTKKTGPLKLTEEFERVVEGQLEPENFDVVSDLIGGTMSNKGVRQIGRSLEGHVGTGTTISNFKLSSRNGRTKINVKSTPFGAILMGLYPCFMTGVIATAGLASSGQVAPAIATGVGLAALGGILFKVFLKKGHQAAARLADRVRDRVKEQFAEGSPNA